MTAEWFTAGFDSQPAVYKTGNVSNLQKGMIMKKYEQELINNEVLEAINTFNEIVETGKTESTSWRRLRSCSAETCFIVDSETGEIIYTVLKSYNTIVALLS